MSLLLDFVKKICLEEGIDFKEFAKTMLNKEGCKTPQETVINYGDVQT